MPAFGRLITAMASPMLGDRSLDVEGAHRLATHLVDTGSSGVVVAGTTGESPTLSWPETLDLVAAVTDAVGDRADVLVGVGTNSTATTVSRAVDVTSLGVDGLLVVSPYYNLPSQRGLHEHFSAVAGATDLPVMLYDIPGRTAVRIQPETTLALAEAHRTIVGVKDASGDLVGAAGLAARAPDHFAVWSGDDKSALPLLAVGGYGLVSVAAHLVGRDIETMLSAADHDLAASRAIHQRLLPLFTGLFIDSNPAPLKAALGMLGLPGGPVRPPLADADPEVVATLRRMLGTLGIDEVGP